MNNAKLAQAAIAALALLAFAACGGSPGAGTETPSDAPDPSRAAGQAAPRLPSHEELVDLLRRAGLKVEVGGSVEVGFLAGRATELSVNSGPVEVFEYTNTRTAEADTARVSPDGLKVEAETSAGKEVADLSFSATPHYYQAGNLIVLYVGDDSAVLDILQDILVSKFAGE